MVSTRDYSELAIIIVASGTGRRFGGPLPKQFCLLSGRPVLLRTFDIFASTFPGSRILLMLSEEGAQDWSDIRTRYGVSEVDIGGATRTQTVQNAAAILGANPPRYVMVHDGARPLVSPDLLCLLERRLHVGTPIVGPGYMPTDSLECVETGASTPVDRKNYLAVQTPQCFDFELFRKAYTSPRIAVESFTDDLSAVHEITGEAITIVPGDRNNMKITYEADLAVAEALLKHPYPYPLS